MIITILLIICTVYMVRYALRPKTSSATRIIFLLIAILSWFIPYLWIATLLIGAFCWAEARTPGGRI